MKKLFIPLLIVLLTVTGCGSTALSFTLEQAPEFQKGELSEFIIKVTEGDKGATGLSIIALLEMEKMDHGVIEVQLEDIGDGLYKGSAELSMGGDWLVELKTESGKKTVEEVLTFEVKER